MKTIAEELEDSVLAVTKTWAKQRKAEERDANARARRVERLTPRGDRVTIREAAFWVMEDAYRRASNNGRLPTNPRQIYYAARREILEKTDRDALRSDYFLQTLLRAYMETHDCSHWDVVWDARGHFTEPHTKEIVPLGTLEVRQYVGERPIMLGPAVKINSSVLYPTKGPENRYKNVLFVEKEGFDPLLKASQIAECFDLAIMSTKGMSVSASRLLLDRLVDRGVEKVFVLHDFDISGFSIIGTLATSSKAYRYRNQVTIVDLGLRLADVEDMDLLSEPFVTDDDWGAIARTLKRHGATEDEIEFLAADSRVEINAMDSEQFIDFLKRKLAEHGVEKLIPDDAVMIRHARRVCEELLAEKALENESGHIRFWLRDVPLFGNATADTILRTLRSNPEGLTRTEINNLFGRNAKAADMFPAADFSRMVSGSAVQTNGFGCALVCRRKRLMRPGDRRCL